MDISVEDHDGVKLVRMRGELTGDEKSPLMETVSELLTGANARIVLDLSEVGYVNSTGLSSLVRLVAQSNLQEARVILANLSAYLAGVLEMTKLDRFFEVRPTAEEALAALA